MVVNAVYISWYGISLHWGLFMVDLGWVFLRCSELLLCCCWLSCRWGGTYFRCGSEPLRCGSTLQNWSLLTPTMGFFIGWLGLMNHILGLYHPNDRYVPPQWMIDEPQRSYLIPFCRCKRPLRWWQCCKTVCSEWLKNDGSSIVGVYKQKIKGINCRLSPLFCWKNSLVLTSTKWWSWYPN